MAEISNVAKIAVFLGFVFLIVALLYPNETGWSNFNNAIRTFPSFNNPFDIPDIQRFTALPEGPTSVRAANTSRVTYVGCTSALSHACINTDDDNTSFIQMNFTGLGGIGSSQIVTLGLYHNITDESIRQIDYTKVAGWTWRVSCRTQNATDGVTGVFDANALISFTTTYNGTSGIFCPESVQFVDSVYQIVLPAGVNPAGPIAPVFGSFESTFIAANGDWLTPGPRSYNMTVDVSFIQLSIVLRDPNTTGCRIPEGAWFPWADETACAIANIGGGIIKAFQFVVNGIVFVAQIIVWFLSLMVAFFALFAFFFAIPGMPSLAQGIITVLIIGCLLFITIYILALVRGTGSTG